jgi:hypothetical protein
MSEVMVLALEQNVIFKIKCLQMLFAINRNAVGLERPKKSLKNQKV